MAARRSKTQARRNTGNSAGLPGWAWMIIGIVLTIVVVLAAPKFLKSGASDGFFRPRPNPDARPAITDSADDEVIAPDNDGQPVAPPAVSRPNETQYDFYTMLPSDEVQMSDAELAASARAEAERQTLANAAKPTPAATPAVRSGDAPVTATVAPTAAASTDGARYILQAGAFGASGDAEAVKAKIALLGLSARVESAQVSGKTVYRVRMGPYGTASELADAKQKLGNGGLPAMAIKAR